MLTGNIISYGTSVKINLELIRNNIKENYYDLIMTERKSKKKIILKENINLCNDKVIEINDDLLKSKLNKEEKRYDLYLLSKHNNKKYRIKCKKNNRYDKYIHPIIDIDNFISGIIYYTEDNGISIERTRNIEESMRKCNKLSYKINYEHKNKSVMLISRNFNIEKMKYIGDSLELQFSDSVSFDNYKDVKVYLLDRENKEKYYFNIEERDVINKQKIKLHLKQFIKYKTEENKRWDLYLEYKDDEVVAHGRIGMYQKNFENKSEKYINAIVCKDNIILSPYITDNNGISFMVNTLNKYSSERYNTNISVTDVKVSNSKIYVKGEFDLLGHNDYKVNNVVLSLRNKTKDKLDYVIEVKSSKLRNGYKYEFEIDTEKFEFEQFYWDLYLVSTVNNEQIKTRIKNISKRAEYKINNKVIRYTVNLKDNYIFYPYITVNNCLSFTFRQKGEYESVKYKVREIISKYIYKAFKVFLDSRDSWLIYEKYSDTAQDNSFYFFKHCYENHPERNVYYVINKNSPDYDNVKPYKDKVVHFMSIKHLLLICSCKLLVASESRAHAYAWKVQRGYVKNKLAQKKMVFLQHGVIALKRIDNGFRKNSPNGCDLFVVSSNYEKEIIKEYFKYDDDEVLVNGLARWDVLKDKSKELKNKEIFFMPTWRNWLEEVPEEEFENSSYFRNYIELLNSKKFIKLLKQNNITVNYFVHPKFKYYLDKFTSSCENIRIIQPGDIQVNELLMRASLLITDYSSVAWEMYYQNKPTLFYHFDIDDYNKYQGSYLDLEKELFGDSAYDASELIAYIQKYIQTGFKQPEKFEKMQSDYFAYVDDKNCERMYKNIIKNKKKLYKNFSKRQVIIKELRKNLIIRKYWRIIKNNEMYGSKVLELKNKVFKICNINLKTDNKKSKNKVAA